MDRAAHHDVHRGPRLARVAALFVLGTAAALAPATPGGGGAVLDLSAIDAAVRAGVESGGGGDARALRAYRALERALAKPSAKGLASDVAKVAAVVRGCRKALAGDDALLDARDAALGAARGALEAADADIVRFTDLLDAEKDRAKVLAAAGKARAIARGGADRLLDGNASAAVKSFGKAAKRFAAADALARRLRERSLAGDPAWAVPLADTGAALLSVWGEAGPSPALFAVGAADDSGPWFLHLAHAGEAWVRVPVAPAGDLWWVTGIPGAGVWASGTDGLVVTYDPATGRTADRSTGVDATLFGIWGASGSDVWAVGGDPDGIGPVPALLHYDGATWTPVTPPAEAAGKILYKVWGSGPADVWACGQGGVILRFDGDSWSVVPSGTASTLLTLHGAGGAVAAVGGGGVSAVTVERPAAGTFASRPMPPATPALNGVFLRAPDDALAVGFTRTVLRRDTSGWAPLAGVPTAARDLHAVWIDEEGNAVMVGGNLFNLEVGTLVTYGRRTIPSEIVDAVGFRGDVADILYLNCAVAGCHLAPFLNENLDFSTPEVALAGIVGVPANQSPLLRVAPGRPSRSYLWHKIEGTHASVGGSGDAMPQGEPALPEETRARIRAWILAGAVDEGP